MPQVEVIFPGIPTDYTYHNPETGQDEQMVEWTFSAVVDGRPETLSGVFAPSVSQERAAHWIKQEVMLAADESGTGEGSVSGGGGGGGDSGGGIPGTSGSGIDIGHIKKPNKMKTEDGT